MSEEAWAQVISVIIAIGLTVVGRLIDRWLPDPDGKHPLPDPPKPTAKPELEPDGDTAP